MSPARPSIGDRVSARVTERVSAADTAAWVEHRLGERLWSKQREIGESVRDHRYTAVRSCHASGKSFLASRLAAHWISSHPVGEAFVVTTAPTGPQLEAILWRELGRAHRAGELPGRVTGGNVPAWRIDGEMVAYGRKPADYADPAQAMQAFQGIHARYVLVLIDEAAGIPRWLWDAVDTLATNENARVLAIGNPDTPASHFAKVCAPGSGWNVLKIAAEDTPNFTEEEVSEPVAESLISPMWVEERRRRWGAESGLFRSKVDAEFPEVSEDTLIGADLIVKAEVRTRAASGAGGTLACDIARLGGDRSVVYSNRGGRVRLVKALPQQETMATTGALVALRASEGLPLVLDVGGLGIGVYDRLIEQNLGGVHAFNGAERARRADRFVNRRAETFWALREAMMRGEVDLDPLDEELAAQLGSLRWLRDSQGRIQIESKDAMKKRGLPSPDRADAVAMLFALGDTWREVLPLTDAEVWRREQGERRLARWKSMDTETWLSEMGRDRAHDDGEGVMGRDYW